MLTQVLLTLVDKLHLTYAPKINTGKGATVSTFVRKR